MIMLLDVRACGRFGRDGQARHIRDEPCHHKRFKVLKAISNFSQPNALHAASNGVAQSRKIVGSWQQWKVVGVVDGQDVKPDPESNRAYFAPSACDHENPLGWSGHVDEPGFGLLRRLIANGTWEVHKDDCCIGTVVAMDRTALGA